MVAMQPGTPVHDIVVHLPVLHLPPSIQVASRVRILVVDEIELGDPVHALHMRPEVRALVRHLHVLEGAAIGERTEDAADPFVRELTLMTAVVAEPAGVGDAVEYGAAVAGLVDRDVTLAANSELVPDGVVPVEADGACLGPLAIDHDSCGRRGSEVDF